MSRLALLLALLVSVACSSPKAPANQDASGDVVTSDTSTLDAPETTGLDVTPNDGVADDTSPGDVSSFDSTGELGQPCRTSNDCKSRSGAYCLTPGTTVCGICRTPQSPCQTHTDCASIDNSYVCDSLRAQTGCPLLQRPGSRVRSALCQRRRVHAQRELSERALHPGALRQRRELSEPARLQEPGSGWHVRAPQLRGRWRLPRRCLREWRLLPELRYLQLAGALRRRRWSLSEPARTGRGS